MDTKAIPNIGNGPFDLTDEYSYSFEILDDDDPHVVSGIALDARASCAQRDGRERRPGRDQLTTLG